MLLLHPETGVSLPAMAPGQFVEVLAPTAGVFLRRPISICDVDRENQMLYLMVAAIGKGTEAIVNTDIGQSLKVLFPLGRGFTIPEHGTKPLLIGGGVGIAPLLYMCRILKTERGIRPSVLLGARTCEQLGVASLFEAFADVYLTSEDGSIGERGFVTNHSVLQKNNFDAIYCCGPRPMMEAVAHYAASSGIPLEVSLENTMACGLGACLCCVEETTTGNRCVCTDGPVFNITELKWL